MYPKKLLVGAIVVIGLAAALGLRAETHDCKLCGTWILLDRIDKTADGRVVDEPNLGSDPVGIIVYDAAGNIAVQLMKRNRPSASGPATTATTPQSSNNSAASSNGYDAYFWKYVVDERARTVAHHVEGAIEPGDVGKTFTRSYEFVGHELHLSFDTTNNGAPVRRTLRWRRAA